MTTRNVKNFMELGSLPIFHILLQYLDCGYLSIIGIRIHATNERE